MIRQIGASRKIPFHNVGGKFCNELMRRFCKSTPVHLNLPVSNSVYTIEVHYNDL